MLADFEREALQRRPLTDRDGAGSVLDERAVPVRRPNVRLDRRAMNWSATGAACGTLARSFHRYRRRALGLLLRRDDVSLLDGQSEETAV